MCSLNPEKTRDPKKIHVLHLIDSLGVGGAQEIVWNILKKGKPADIRYTVAVLHEEQSKYYESRMRAAGAEVVYLSRSLKTGPYLSFPLLCARFRAYLRRVKPQVLHMHLQGSMMVGCVASAGLPVKRMLNVYAWPSQVQSWVYPTMKLFTPMIKKIQFLTREAMPWVPESKFIQAHAGVDLDIDFKSGTEGIRKEFGLAANEIYFFSVGRFHPDKGHDSAIGVFARVYEKNPKIRLFVIGTGPQKEERRLKTLADALGVASSVIFTGYRDDLPFFFGLGGFYLRTSVNEPGNMTNVLAQYAGLACMGFRVDTVNGSAVDFIDHEVTGWLGPLGDVTAMASAILEWIDHPEKRTRIGKDSADFIAKHRDIDKLMIQPYVANYVELSKSSGC